MSVRGARLDGRVPGTAVRGAQVCMAALMSSVTLLGCSDPGPAPTIDSVTPAQAYSNVPVPILVDATMLRAGLVIDISGQDARYEDGTIHMALVGEEPGLPQAVELDEVQSLDGVGGRRFLATVPMNVAPGVYGLRITPANGHPVIAHAAFQELGLDVSPPVVVIDTPAPGTIGIGNQGTTVTATLSVDDGFGELLAINWSTSNLAAGTCLLTPQVPTNAPPRNATCVATFAIASLAPADGLGVPFWFQVDATDVAGNIGQATVELTVANMPSISSFERAYGALQGQQPITIHGAYFSQDATAYIDVDAIVGYPPGTRPGGDVQDSGTIIGLTPRGGQARDVPVFVKTIAGLGSGPYPFRYTAPPKVRLIEPATGPSSGGKLLTIAGNDLLDGVIISFGDVFETSVPLYNPSYSANDKVVGCLPPGPSGPVSVWASDLVTGKSELVGGFTYTDDDDVAATVSPGCETADGP